MAHRTFLERILISGTLAGTAAAIAVSLAGRRETGSYAAPLNATSHILWGDEAAQQDGLTARYTATGALLHYGAALFWAALHESVPGPAPARAAFTALAAYVVDYHVVPRRLTPGIELRVSSAGLTAFYGALAAGLWAGSVASR